jgi:hypothetical protein
MGNNFLVPRVEIVEGIYSLTKNVIKRKTTKGNNSDIPNPLSKKKSNNFKITAITLLLIEIQLMLVALITINSNFLISHSMRSHKEKEAKI